MKAINKLLPLLLFSLFNPNLIEAKEVFLFKKTSFLFQEENSDSLYLKKLKIIEDIYKEEQYIDAIKLGLNLLDSIPKDEYLIKYKLNCLIAEIYNRYGKRYESLKFYKDALS